MGAREHALLRFRDACLSEQAVVAAFVGGSVAAHSDDEVSDLDLYAVTLEPEYEQFFSRRHAFMRTWARPLLMVDTLDFEGLGFDMLHFVLDDGVYGELALGRPENLRVMHGGPHEVLVDKVGLLSGVTFSKHVPTRTELRQQAEHHLNWFWFDYLQLRKHHHRGHSVAAANVLCRLRAQCASLLALAHAEKLNIDVAAMNDRLDATLEADDSARAASAVAVCTRSLARLSRRTSASSIRLNWPTYS